MHDILIYQMKNEVTSLGVRELRTPGDVDSVLANQKGTVLVFVNSVCGCAGEIARPALRMALDHDVKPDLVTTVFASGDHEATAHARKYFAGMPPSSPSFAILRNGKLVEMIHRSDIEIREAGEVAGLLKNAFDKHCTPSPAH